MVKVGVIAIDGTSDETEDDLLAAADRAMYRGKSSRRTAPGQLELFALRPRTTAPDPALMDATVVLKATLDLVIERADGSIDVIDYKRSRGGDEARSTGRISSL